MFVCTSLYVRGPCVCALFLQQVGTLNVRLVYMVRRMGCSMPVFAANALQVQPVNRPNGSQETASIHCSDEPERSPVAVAKLSRLWRPPA